MASSFNYDLHGNQISQHSTAASSPLITSQPRGRVVAPGDNAGFSVGVSSSSTASFQWFLNGDPLPSATGDSLYFPSVGSVHEGTYTVAVTNASGSVTSLPARLGIDAGGNGLPDAWEIERFGSQAQSASGDYDGDSISNLDEFLQGTDPTVREPYLWVGNGGDFFTAANWNRNRVPGAGDRAFIDQGDFTVPSATTRLAFEVTVNRDFAASASADTVLNGTWTFNGAFNLSTGRTLTASGGSVTLNGPVTLNGGNLSCRGTGTHLIVSGLTQYTQPNNTNVSWQVGDPTSSATGAELSFPNLVSIQGGITTANQSRYFEITATKGCTLSLPALATITVPAETANIGDSGVKLTGTDQGILSAPNLVSFSDATPRSHSWLIAEKSGRLVIPQLLAPDGIQIDLNALSHPEQFVALPRTWSFAVNAGEVTMGLSGIAQMLFVQASGNGTRLNFPNVVSFSQPNNTGITWEAGESTLSSNTGCELNFPNLTTITGGITTSTQSPFFELRAVKGGSLNLPALASIAVPAETAPGSSGVILEATDAGLIRAPELAAFSDATTSGNSELIANKSGRLEIPKLLAPDGIQIDLNALSHPEQFQALPRTRSFSLNAGQVAMGLSNINHMAEIYAKGASTRLSFPMVTSYQQPNNTDVVWQAGDQFQSNNPGCHLEFPNLAAITGGITTSNTRDRLFELISRRGGTLDLPRLTTISVPADTVPSAESGIRLYTLDNGTLNAARLVEFRDTSSPSVSRLEATASGHYRYTSLRQEGLQGVALIGVTLPTGPVTLQVPAINSAAQARTTSGAFFSYQITASNSPLSYDASPLPAGLSVDHLTGIISGTPSSFGSFTVNLMAANPDGEGTATLLLDIVHGGLEAYLSTASVPEPSRGPLDDPDHDGFANILEYAFNRDPMHADSRSVLELSSSGTLFVAGYTAARDDLVYRVETSENLSSWTTSGVDQGSKGADNRVNASIPIDGAHRFLRLSVELRGNEN